MSEKLLSYYNRELSYLRRMGAEYAKKYPKIAGRLKLDDESVEDPHVSRLLEGVSLLTAQIRQKLDDSFPELTDALMGQLAPDYQVTIPSMAICQLNVNDVASNGILFKKGSQVTTDVDGFKPCEFSSCYDTDAKPVCISDIKFKNAPFKAPDSPWLTKPKSVLQVNINHLVKDEALSSFGLNKLRFFLGDHLQHAYTLYEHLFRHLIGIVATSTTEDGSVITKTLEKRHLAAVGFDPDEAVIPYSKKTFDGYRLLVEQFVFPQKFLFVELNDLASKITTEFGDEVEFHFYFSENSTELEANINDDSLKLHCTPIINSFSQELEAIELDPGVYEYRVVSYYGEEASSEVLNVTDVQYYNKSNELIKASPFYASTHPRYEQDEYFWVVRRQLSDWSGGVAQKGTELYLSFVDRNFNAYSEERRFGNGRLLIKGLCSNKNLPVKLPYGGGSPKLKTPQGGHMVQSAACITGFTPVVRPEMGGATRWQLLRLLSLDFFSGEDARDKLCDLLHLFNFGDEGEANNQINHIEAITITPATAKLQVQGRMGVCYGNDINLVMNPAGFSGSNMFFFATVLDLFFAQFAAINSFTRLSVTRHGETKPYHVWSARSGTKALL